MRFRFVVLLALLLAPAGEGGSARAAQRAASPPESPVRAWMGVFLGDALDGGVQLVAVVPGGPAARGGLLTGDVVVEASGVQLLDVADLTRLLERVPPGELIQLELLRAGRPLERAVRLGERATAPVPLSPPAPPFPRAAPAPPLAGACRVYGLQLAEVTADLRRHYGAPADAGLLVTGIDAGLPAAGDGLRVGDLLVHLAGQPVRGLADVDRLLATGDGALPALLVRDGRLSELMLRAAPAAARDQQATARRALSDRVTAQRALERSVRQEIERLNRRLEELKRLLEAERDSSEP